MFLLTPYYFWAPEIDFVTYFYNCQPAGSAGVGSFLGYALLITCIGVQSEENMNSAFEYLLFL